MSVAATHVSLKSLKQSILMMTDESLDKKVKDLWVYSVFDLTPQNPPKVQPKTKNLIFVGLKIDPTIVKT